MRAYSIDCNHNTNELTVKCSDNYPKMEENVINVFPTYKKHKIEGFGGALTHSTGHVLNKMNKEEALEVLDAYYNPQKANYTYVRIPIDSCDFSLNTFNSASSVTDIENQTLNFSHDEDYIFPWLDEINKIAKTNIPILLSPWSPPAFMKDNNNRLQGGKLNKEMYAYWAQNMALYAKEYINRGYNVWAVTLQNEPNATQTWDSCIYTAEDEAEFFTYLQEALSKLNLNDVGIFYWDHNKERLLQRAQVFTKRNSTTNNKLQGIAFHGYCGDHFHALELYRKLYPNHKMIMSEYCLAFVDRDDSSKQMQLYAHEWLGDLNNGAQIMFDWNLLLDCQGGPNHVGNFCMAPMMANKEYKVHTNTAFDVLSSISKSFVVGSDVVEHTKFSESLDILSAKRPDGVLVIALYNKEKAQVINIRVNDRVFSIKALAETLTFVELEEKIYE